ncbi:MAG: hypothetical protein HYS13_00220 [Planctomycetia bacterium]|nr:hypothetical protein [Planctomycetia bacterium]
MSRRRPGSPPTVSLFPFLAVLLCTLGALIVVLVVITQMARKQALADDPSHSAAADAAAARLATLQESAALLEAQRDAAAADEIAGRQRIAALEDQIRAIDERLAAIRRQIEQTPPGNTDDKQKDQLQREFTWYLDKLAETDVALRKARQKAQQQRETFSIIPYRGPNGTVRRPVYLECREESIVVQPEGTEFSAADFESSPEVGPLMAMLRATSAYWRSRGMREEESAPYPLFLVRPDGIESYYVAVETVREAGMEFGYEFIEQDWPLAFSKPNLELASQQALAVDGARKLQTRLAASGVGRRDRRAPSFRVSPSGGLVMVDPGSGGSSRTPGGAAGGPDDDDVPGGRTGNSSAAGRRDTGRSLAGAPPRGAGTGAASGTGYHPGNSSRFAADSLLSGSGSGGGSRSSPGLGAGGSGRNGAGDYGQRAGQGDRTFARELAGASGLEQRGRRGGASGNDDATDSSVYAGPGGNRYANTGPANAPSGIPGATGGTGGPADEGGRNPTASGDSAATGASSRSRQSRGSSAATGSSGAGAPSSAPGIASSEAGQSGTPNASLPVVGPHAPSVNIDLPPPSDRDDRPDPIASLPSIAQQRGANWALPGSSHAVRIARTIRVRIEADKLCILGESPRSPALKTIHFTARTIDAVDELRSGLWEVMEDWGSAGRGMSWKPILEVDVAQSGVRRYRELAALLRDSGVVLEPIAKRDDTRR